MFVKLKSQLQSQRIRGHFISYQRIRPTKIFAFLLILTKLGQNKQIITKAGYQVIFILLFEYYYAGYPSSPICSFFSMPVSKKQLMHNCLGTNTDFAQLKNSLVHLYFKKEQILGRYKKNRLVICSLLPLIRTAAIFNQSKLNSIKLRFSQLLKQHLKYNLCICFLIQFYFKTWIVR